MNIWVLLGSLLLSGNHPVAGELHSGGDTAATQKLLSVIACQGESSPLVRLECYDNALATAKGNESAQFSMGPDWLRAMDQEKKRTDHSTTLMVSEGSRDNPVVIVTTPAIGVPPPRPVLMFSCIDNITRLQIALSEPQKNGSLKISADSDSFDVQWFLRENGYLLESSRGLAGIDEIKRLMPAKTLTIEGSGNGFSQLTFNISQLAQVLKPLRNACHW